MKENKKIEKELLFKNNIKDITSISLDSDYKIENNEIIGNFIISGEYKIHEVSINREKFNFKIPFKHKFDSDIDKDTIKVDITNFIYDYKKDELIVNIEYVLVGDRKSILLFDNEESLDEFLSKREVEVVDTRIDTIKEEISELENNKKEPEILEEKENIELPKEIENPKKEERKIEETKKDEENERKSIDKIEENHLKIDIKPLEKDIIDDFEFKKTEDIIINDEKEKNIIEETLDRNEIETSEIINNMGTKTDGFVTYKVYKLKENETLESIVIKYHTTIDELKEYNELNNLNIGDKIIIPKYE